MRVLKHHVSFDGGEISPWLYGRIDLAKYESSARVLENFIPLPQGGLLKRPGRQFRGKLPLTATNGRIVEFEVASNMSYLLVIGGGKMRFYYNGAEVQSGGSGYEIAVPWADAKLDGLRWKQLNDVMFFVHREYPPKILKMISATNWTLADFVPGRGQPYLPENLDREHKITATFELKTDASVLTWAADRTYVVGKIVKFGSPAEYYKCEHLHASTTSNDPGDGATYTDPISEEPRPIWTKYFVDTASTVGQEVTLTSNKALWTAAHVGGYFELGKKRAAADYSTTLAPDAAATAGNFVYSNVKLVQGRWTFATFGTWIGLYQIQISRDRGKTWTSIRSVFSSSKVPRNVSFEGEEKVRALIRIAYTNYTVSSDDKPYALLELYGDTVYGSVKITGFTNSKQVTAETVERIEFGETFIWSEGAWSGAQGYPGCVEFFQNRIVMAGSVGSPHTVWGSAVDDYNNFRRGTAADEPFAHVILIGQREPIAWLLADRALVIGSAVGEFVLRGENEDKPVTPETGYAMQQSSIGSHLKSNCIRISTTTLFVQHGGRVVRELAYRFDSDRYESANMNLLADHLFTDEITDVAVQRYPFQLIWFVAGGKLYSFTYEKSQNVGAWARHPSAGNVISVACIRKAANDEVWFITEYGGKLVVERMVAGGFTMPVNTGAYLDCYMDILQSDTLSGNPLYGLEVIGFENGQLNGPAVLDGEFRDSWGDENRVGLAYAAKVMTTTPEVNLPNGNSRTMISRISRLVVNLYRAIGGKVAEETSGENSVPISSSVGIFSGEATVNFDSHHGTEGNFCIISDTPHPFGIRSLSYRFEITENDSPQGQS